jgi:hypothetical protein
MPPYRVIVASKRTSVPTQHNSIQSMLYPFFLVVVSLLTPFMDGHTLTRGPLMSALVLLLVSTVGVRVTR